MIQITIKNKAMPSMPSHRILRFSARASAKMVFNGIVRLNAHGVFVPSIKKGSITL
jgi:hypothetical protein